MRHPWIYAALANFLVCAAASPDRKGRNHEIRTQDGVKRSTCVVSAGGKNTTDDAPTILEAFTKCVTHGRIVFQPTTYYVNSVLNVRWLQDMVTDLYGTLESELHQKPDVLYFKTWTVEQSKYPPNGGSGGYGSIVRVRCSSCWVSLSRICTGATTSPRVGSFRSSAVNPCTNIGLLDIDLKLYNSIVAPDYLLGHVAEAGGWNRTRSVCEESSAIGEC
ncbi:exo-rhamnogalacturonase b [Seiridium cupressi]